MTESRIARPSGQLTPFTLALSPTATPVARGRICALDGVVTEILSRHDYPAPVALRVAEACVLATLLASGLKYSGAFTLQTQGKGPLSRLVADIDSDGHLRACATVEAERLAALLADHPDPSNADLTGTGHLAFTVDQGPDMDRYQGIVELMAGGLTDSVFSYFRQSEQIPTDLRLQVVPPAPGSASGLWTARGLLIQRMPGEGGFRPMERDPAPTPEEDDLWDTACVFLDSLTDAELAAADLGHEALLFRLFHELNVRALPAREIGFGCRCSENRLRGTLASFDYAELAEVADADGALDVTCEFCRETYRFALSEFAPAG